MSAKKPRAVTPRQVLAFVKRHGVVLQSARGAVPNVAEFVAGEPIRGSWWSHPAGKVIFRACAELDEHPDVLSCTLVDGKVTYVHARLWPALVKLADRFPTARLARSWQEHTASGEHRKRRVPFPRWVPEDVARLAARTPVESAEAELAVLRPTRS